MTKQNEKDAKRVPELRFKGFTDDWEQRKLGDLGSVQMNKRIFKDQTSESGEVPFFKIGTFGKKPDSFISKKLFDEYKSKYPYPEVGDILISASGSIGRTVVYEGEDAYFQDSNIVWLEHDGRLKNSFLEQFLKRTKWNKIEGSTIKRLYNKDILNKKINLPKLKEQEKVGQLFQYLDKTITLHEEKHRQLERLKKALLQKMFADETGYPALRFKGFTAKWEQRKLGDITRRYDNLRVPVTASKRKHGDIPYYGANGIQDFVSGYTHDGEFILVAEDGARDPKNYPVNYVNGKIWVNNHAHVLQGIQGLANNLFLLNGIKKINIVAYLVGGSRAKLNAETLMQLSIKLPSIHEQEKIGQLFQSLDKTITLHDKKIQYLKQLKRGLLQKMFI